MQHTTLGNTGTIVSTFALGTMTFGAEADEKTSHALLDTITSRRPRPHPPHSLTAYGNDLRSTGRDFNLCLRSDFSSCQMNFH